MTNASEHTICERLKQLHIYRTITRTTVLNILHRYKGGISLSRIRAVSDTALDRVSVYRTLQLFIKKGLVLRIPTSSGNPRYMLKEEPGKEKNLFQVYYICKQCSYTELLDTPPLRLPVKKPTGHSVMTCTVVVEGICRDCK